MIESIDSIGLIIAIAAVIVVVVLQVRSFIETRTQIKKLKSFFPCIDTLNLKDSSLSKEILKNSIKLKEFINNIPSKQTQKEGDFENDYIDVSLITMGKNENNSFASAIAKTNIYLCKNVGTSADFSVLKEICEHRIDALEDEIHNSLNTPLYLGLAGTFIGIIAGLWGVDFTEILGESKSLDGLQHLLYGIIVAMIASLLGLGLTVYNSTVSYKKAVNATDIGKEEYYDFLRRELMPILSNSMASSLNSLKGVLGHFVDKFGHNLDAYADSAALLNDNLEKQHLVLEEINQLSLTKTANKIAETFVALKESSESLDVFKSYQIKLNSTMKGVSEVVEKVDDVIGKFEDFGLGLTTIVKNQNLTSELQQEFKQAIETHFPTGSEGRDVWRKEFDYLMEEAKSVSENLSSQLSTSTEYIQNFVSNNNEFFDSLEKMKEIVTTLVQYTQVQAECYRDLKDEVLNLRKDYKDAQIDSIDLNKSILKAVETMTTILKDKNREQ